MKKYLLFIVLLIAFAGCNNEPENDFLPDVPPNSEPTYQAVIGDTEYEFKSKAQLLMALQEMERKGETLKSLKTVTEMEMRSSAAPVFTFQDGTTNKTYYAGENGIERYDYVDVNVISTVNGQKSGFKIFTRSLWTMIMEYEYDYTIDSRRLLANPNISGANRTGFVVLEQIETGAMIVVNVIQQGSPRTNIFHCDGTEVVFLHFPITGGTQAIPSITSTVSGVYAGYASINNYIESNSYPDWLTISGFGANQFIVTVQPDPALVHPKEMAFSIKQNGTNEYITIYVNQGRHYLKTYIEGGWFPKY